MTAELVIIDTKLALQTDLAERTHGAALEIVTLCKSDHCIPKAMKAARLAYEKAIYGNKGHEEGSPDNWLFKAGLLAFSQECVRRGHGDMASSVLAIAKALKREIDYIDVCSACTIKDCSEEHAYAGKCRIIIQFGSRIQTEKMAWVEYWDAQDNAEVRAGRAARQPLARAAQEKLTALQKALGKPK